MVLGGDRAIRKEIEQELFGLPAGRASLTAIFRCRECLIGCDADRFLLPYDP
jgi:hypothetical protein